MSTDCPFCLEGMDPSSYKRDWNPQWPYANRIMANFNGAIVVPGHGPQVYPYALVLSPTHRPSFMSLLAEERKAMFNSLDYLTSVSGFGELVCVFEHGGGLGNSCQCLDHCHLHVVSVGLKLYSAFLASDMRKRSRSIELDDAKHRRAPESYLFIGLHRKGDQRLVGEFMEPAYGERQYFRRLLAETIGSDWFDWRTGLNQQFMEKLYLGR